MRDAPGDELPPGGRRRLARRRRTTAERVKLTARDGLAVEGTLWRPAEGNRPPRIEEVPVVLSPHGGPTWQAYRGFAPFKMLLVERVSRSSTSTSAAPPVTAARSGWRTTANGVTPTHTT